MKKFISLSTLLIVAIFGQLAIQAQTTGSIAGAVVDQNEAVVPNATVKVTGQGGQEFTVVTGDNGLYKIPAVPNGLYAVSVSATGFKTSNTTNVKVDVGIPTTVDSTLEVGDVGEIVEVTSGGEVLQTQTATVGTTITGRQIVETPIPSRDALDLIGLLPGTNSVGAPRRSSINGLPKGSLSITIDGVDVQDNLLRSSDGYFTYVRPRVDAIEEVTVSTANPGAESSGDGAVQIRFVTRRGTNLYGGGLFWQHRDESLNANYWYNNQLLAPIDGKAPRQKIRLNQYGGRFGGPLPFPHFGEGGPFFHSGKDKAFFFVNYEEFRQPESQTRSRVILTPEAEKGSYSYLSGGVVRTYNVFDIVAGNAAAVAAGGPTTIDPTVAAVFARIRSAVSSTGTITPVSSTAFNTRNYNFTPQGGQVRKFLANRYDFNLTKDHSVEFVMNRQTFVPSKDFLNNQDERFPDFPSYAQGSTRNSYTSALRSTFGQNVVNEFRFATSQGSSEFSPGISANDFSYSGGNLLDVSTTLGGTSSTTGTGSISSPYSRNSYSARSSPTYDWTDSVNWIKGNHNISFGGQYKRIRLVDTIIGRIVPIVTFGVDSTETALTNAFNTTTLPGSTSTQQAEARMLYATLAGHVLGYTATAYLTADGTYKIHSEQTRLDHQDTYGLYAQDTWRLRPGLTINYGLRWQPQGSYVIDSGNYARLSSFEQVYGVSGFGNIFRPGTLTGTAPTVVGMQIGESAYNADKNNFAPTVGVVWSPNFGEKGILPTIFGGKEKSVFRGGYSISFVREGTALIGSILGANPGGNLSASRNLSNGNLTTGTNLRENGNPNLTPATFSTTPAYPITLTTANSANGFDSNLKTGSVHSFSFGYQREINRNTVIEARYVGTRGYDLFRQHNLNEINTIENGLAAEYQLAQQNLYANIAANRCQAGVTAANCQYNFAYFGPGSGTSPLPISLAYISGAINGHSAALTPGALNQSGTVSVSTAASNPANYSNALFRNSAFASNLNRTNPAVITFAGNLEGAASRRLNALAAGLPSNFFFVNPTTATSGAYIIDNSGHSWYDAVVIELRRRLSDGLRIQANYTFGKARTDSFQSNSDNFANYTHRDNGSELAKTVAVFDIRHAFKLDATYDLPFGRGKSFFSNSNGIVNALIGGFTLSPVIRWQSGSPIQVGNVQLIGMTVEELQKSVKVRKEANFVYWLPDDIIVNSQRAFNTDPFSSTGYGTTYGGSPQGRFIAPAGYNNCQQRYAGECGFNNLIIYGPSFFKFDISVAKKFNLTEKRNVELRATFLDALNMPNFRVGGWNADVVTSGCCGGSFGQLGSGSAYQDISTTNDPGGRLVDLMLRINF